MIDTEKLAIYYTLKSFNVNFEAGFQFVVAKTKSKKIIAFFINRYIVYIGKLPVTTQLTLVTDFISLLTTDGFIQSHLDVQELSERDKIRIFNYMMFRLERINQVKRR